VELRKQFVHYLRRFGVEMVSAEGDVESILKCVAAGYFSNAARLGLDGR
jgi:hypothetical protein